MTINTMRCENKRCQLIKQIQFAANLPALALAVSVCARSKHIFTYFRLLTKLFTHTHTPSHTPTRYTHTNLSTKLLIACLTKEIHPWNSAQQALALNGGAREEGGVVGVAGAGVAHSHKIKRCFSSGLNWK